MTPSFTLRDFPIANLVNFPPPLILPNIQNRIPCPLSSWRSFLHHRRAPRARSAPLSHVHGHQIVRRAVPSPPSAPSLLVLPRPSSAVASRTSRQRRARSDRLFSTPRRVAALSRPPGRHPGAARLLPPSSTALPLGHSILSPRRGTSPSSSSAPRPLLERKL